MEERGQNRITQVISAHGIPERGGVALAVAFGTLLVSAKPVGRLPGAGTNAGGEELNWIENVARNQRVFLFCREWSGVVDVAGVEIRNDPNYPLLLLRLYLFSGHLFGGTHRQVSVCRRHPQEYSRYFVSLLRRDNNLRGLGGLKILGVDHDAIRTGR